ncbi:MAG: serine/threonine-protein kinase [Myxococcota bacterium]
MARQDTPQSQETPVGRYLAARALSSSELSSSALRSRGAVRSLPESLVRLKAFVVAMGFLAAVGTLVDFFGPDYLGFEEVCANMGVMVHGKLVLLSLAFLAVIKSGKLTWPRLLDLALVYVVVSAFSIAIAEQSRPTGGMSMVPLLLVLFPLFVPTTPQRIALTALAGATMLPAAILLHDAVVGEPPPGPRWTGVFFTYLISLLAVLPAKIVWKLSKRLERAEQLGSYELVESIGAGGMGEVWSARHQMLRRPAAIKLIRPEALGNRPSDSEKQRRVVERFEREAQATAQLESPHTVQLYDFGVSNDGVLYHVMELLHGMDLETLVKETGPLPPERVAFVLLQVLDSLDDAHRSGLVHRDVKPANLFVARKGQRVDYVKVLDFGLVKERSQDTALTGDGELTGTPAYLAPEMAAGEAAVDGRADLYALGCVAYWLLTGERVFEKSTAIKVAVAHLTEEPVAPSDRTDRPVPAALEDLVLDLLAKNPDHRPQNAGEVADRLRTMELAESWTHARAIGWWRRHLPELSENLGDDVRASLSPVPQTA